MNEPMQTLNDEQMMLLMAYADGELDGDELAQVQALVRDNHEAKAWMDGFVASKGAMSESLMSQQEGPDLAGVATRTHEQTEAVQLMAFVDGELSELQRENAGIEALLETSTAARAWVNDLQTAKRALHDEVMQPNMEADLSMIRGRVMRKLPAEPRAPVEEAPKGLFPAITAWLADLGFGKTVMAAGALAAVLLVAIAVGKVGNQPAQAPVEGPVAHTLGGPTAPATTAASDGEPEVIIEEMESDGGTVIFEGGEKPGEAVIIWHIDPSDEGAG